MAEILTASSPVEIEAKADEIGLDATARAAALALFHDLTSRLELSSFRVSHDGGQDWPQHRFYFGLNTGPQGDRIKAVLDTLQLQENAQEVTTAPQDGPHPTTLYIGGGDGQYGAVLVAGADLGP